MPATVRLFDRGYVNGCAVDTFVSMESIVSTKSVLNTELAGKITFFFSVGKQKCVFSSLSSSEGGK